MINIKLNTSGSLQIISESCIANCHSLTVPNYVTERGRVLLACLRYGLYKGAKMYMYIYIYISSENQEEEREREERELKERKIMIAKERARTNEVIENRR